MSLQELGSQAYQKALFADYNGAVQLLDKAIVKFPRDEKLLNNRSFCLLKLKDYQRALQDAETMVKQFPKYTKGYYRSAEALIGLKRFIEAERLLNILLQMDPNCTEAEELLFHAQSQNKVRRVTNLSSMDFSSGASKEWATNSSSEEIYHSDEDLNKMLARAESLVAAEKGKSKKKKKKGALF